MKATKNIFSALLVLLLISSCTSKLGKFTALSTDNVRGLEYAGKNRDEIINVAGKSCNHRIYATRTIAGLFLIFPWFMPSFDISLGDDSNDRLENSIDNALRIGRQGGVFDGDIITNASVTEKNIIVPLLYGYKCIIVKGDVVSSVVRKKGYLEKK